MATKGEKHARLHDFLEGSFKAPAFQRLLKLRGLAEVAQAVDRNVGGTEYFFDVIETLDLRGEIDPHFFDCLMKERPRKKPKIEELKALWLDEDKSFKPYLKELAKQVKSAQSLVELVCCIGKAVVQAGYEEQQADFACSHYRERYEQRYAQVKILGKAEPVELASIYTEVHIVPPTFLRGYRTQEELQELFRQKGGRLAGFDFNRVKLTRGLEAVNDQNHRFLNLLGAPGAGKSTFLRHIGWMALQRHRPSTTAPGSRYPATAPYRFNLLPVLLELRSLRNASSDFVALADEELTTNGFPAGFGRTALQAGGLLVLLDGLDEVPADKLDDTIQGIRNLVDQHPECRYITSCRTAFYRDYFPRFTDALLTDFTDDQIQNLIENWFHSRRDRELGTAATLWKLLRDPNHQATRELARTPLLATFLCLVYDVRQQLPTNRAELYGDALRILFERWAASKRVHGEAVFPGLSTKRELLMLEGIAGPAYESEQYFFTGQELATAIERFLQSDAGRRDTIDGRKVVEEIEGKQGLLVQRAHDKYSFSHLTLHEYLAACHYHNCGRSQEIAKATLTQRRWREVHLLLAGLQVPNADDFLLAMAIETAEQATSERLKGLLSWTDWIVSIGSSPQNTAARRALMMGFALALNIDHDLAHPRDLDRTLDLDRDLGRALDLARALDQTLDFDRDLGRALDRTLNRVRDRTLVRDLARDDRPGSVVFDRDFVRARSRARSRARDLIRNLGFVIMESGTITAERIESAKAHHTLDRYLMSPEASANVTLQELVSDFDLPPPDHRFSKSDAQQCTEFLTSTQRILECREAAERVTQSGWDRVCERLIAPPRSAP